MNSKLLLLLCVCSFSLKAQSQCSEPSSGNITNGVQSELIRADSGSLLGIEVSWSWSSIVTTECFLSPARVELHIKSSNGYQVIRSEGISITRHFNSVDFFHLDCNDTYTPEVRATNVNSIQLRQSGSPLLFGGAMCTNASREINGGPYMTEATSSTSASTDPTPLIAGVTTFIIMILLGVLVALVMVLVIKRRKKTESQDHVYDTVSEPEDRKSRHVRRIEVIAESSLVAEPTIDDIHDRSENEENTPNKASMKNVLYEPASEPKITDFQQEVYASEGEQVTLRVNFTGFPKPTVTWKFKGTKVEGDYATELGTDGSLLFVCVEKKHAGRYCFDVSNRLASVKGSVTLVVEEGEGGAGEGSLRQNFESYPVTQLEFGEYVASLHSYDNSTFILQYQSLMSGEECQEVTFGRSEVNQPLNRFRNITAYDDRRISLLPLSNYPECQGSYINASYIDGYSRMKQYIASQGPLPNTVTDFWRLVWQEKVRTIAMVTNIKEGKTKKCEQYWPEAGSGMSCGPFNLSLEEQHTFAYYTIRAIQLVHTGEGGSSRKVMQYHFTSWPDHGVPEYAGPILNYLRRINTQHKQNRGPILVHCSAGVGRTGTLIAIDIALSQASKEKLVDIPKIIVDMRRQRMKMVQTADQYVFIHDAVLETLICGDTRVPASDLRRALEKLKRFDKMSPRMTGFSKQFQVLEQISHKPSEVFCDSAKKNTTKNRNNNFLPPEKWRVVLKGETSNYIHASFANGYKQKNGFIIAQSPMANTAGDFVRMLYERECGVVVMLCGCEEGGVEMSTQYWPNTVSTMMKYGEFIVSTVSIIDSCDGFVQREIAITDPKSGQVQKLTQFQVDQWSPEGLCSNPQALLHIIKQMGVAQRRTGNRPIVVHGRDTVSRVSVLCSLVNAIEMCKTEGVVDVFQVVKALRIQKPGAVLNANQYEIIFDLLFLYLDSFSIYSNFK